MPTEHGTTYNSYLVRGTQKTALIDLVKAPFTDEHLKKIQQLQPLDQVDQAISNHTEPDHSGSLLRALEVMPNATVVASRAGLNLLEQIANRPFEKQLANHGDSLDLGGKTLQFIAAPNLHWVGFHLYLSAGRPSPFLW